MFKVIYTVYKSMFCPCMKIFLQFSIYKYYLICIHNCIYIYIFIYLYTHNYRRKFRSQTSDNMDR